MEWMLMPLRRYAEFSGRSRRKEYWMFVLGVFLLFFVLGFVSVFVGGASLMAAFTDPSPDSSNAMMGMFAGMGVFGIIYAVMWLALLVPSLAVGMRRLHDIDRTGWWLGAFYLVYGVLALGSFQVIPLPAVLSTILGLVIVVWAITLLVFFFLDGTKGPNRYGEDPKGTASAEVFT